MSNDSRPASGPAGASVAEMRQGRWNTVGVPTEKSRNFGVTARRLADRLSREGSRVVVIFLLAVVSVVLVVVGPRILGHATNIIFDGLV